MILTHAQIRAIVADPDQLAALMPSQDERESLRELGVRPFADDLLAAYVAGQDLDTHQGDIDRAAVKALAQGRLEQAHDELDAALKRLEG